MIYFTNYAVNKFKLLKKHRTNIEKEDIKKVINFPEKTGIKGTNFTAEKNSIKAVYKKEDGIIKVITFYPVKNKK